MEILELFKQHSQVAFPIGFGGDVKSIFHLLRCKTTISCKHAEGFLRCLP
jgi:hypothetical protein